MCFSMFDLLILLQKIVCQMFKKKDKKNKSYFSTSIFNSIKSSQQNRIFEVEKQIQFSPLFFYSS